MTAFTRRALLKFGAITLTMILGRSRFFAASQSADPIVVINGWILLQSDLDGPIG